MKENVEYLYVRKQKNMFFGSSSPPTSYFLLLGNFKKNNDVGRQTQVTSVLGEKGYSKQELGKDTEDS